MHGQLELIEHIKQAAVRASGAEHGRAHGDAGGLGRARFGRAGEFRGDLAHKQLSLQAGSVLTRAGDAHGLDGVLKEGLHILHHIEGVNAGRKLTDERLGQRVGKAQLEHRRLRQCFLHIVVGSARGNDAPRGGPPTRYG